MKKPPAVATAILMRLGPTDESMVGDLMEEYAGGRSRFWFWRQVLSAVVLGAMLDATNHPLRAMTAITTGWIVLLMAFTFGDTAANGLAKLVWNWDRQTGYGSGIWWPYQICAALVSYAGFALSAFVVARLNRQRPGMLLAYVASVVVTLTASAVSLEIATQQSGRVAVPHPLFYFVSVTLPYQWRLGFLLVPLVMLLCGSASARSRILEAKV